MIACCQRSSHPGFTLVELLVVMAIISILIGLSYPALMTALSHARTLKCSSNLHQIASAMITYAGDNNGNLPDSGSAVAYGNIDANTGQYGWTEQLESYLGVGSAKENSAGSIFQCPDWQQVVKADGTYPNMYYSYYNGAHASHAQSATFVPVSLIKMRTPSAHILAGDVANPNAFAGDVGTTDIHDCDKSDYNLDAAFSSTITIHGGWVNIAFADGHVENLRSFDPAKMTTVYQGPGTAFNYLYPAVSSP